MHVFCINVRATKKGHKNLIHCKLRELHVKMFVSFILTHFMN